MDIHILKGKLDFSAYMLCEKILELYTQQIKQLKSETLDKLKVKAKKAKDKPNIQNERFWVYADPFPHAMYPY